MKYFIILIVVLGFGGGWYWWQTATQVVLKEPSTIPAVVTIDTQATSTAESSGNNVYRNDEWGISFKYPVGWEVKENDINSNSSLFNVVVKHNDEEAPRPIYVLFSTDEWGKNLVERYYRPESDVRQVIGGINAYVFTSSDMGMPTKVRILPVSGTYWVNIVGKTGYETELNQVLESLTINPVEIQE
jgi:hypothetical protein